MDRNTPRSTGTCPHNSSRSDHCNTGSSTGRTRSTRGTPQRHAADALPARDPGARTPRLLHSMPSGKAYRPSIVMTGGSPCVEQAAVSQPSQTRREAPTRQPADSRMALVDGQAHNREGLAQSYQSTPALHQRPHCVRAPLLQSIHRAMVHEPQHGRLDSTVGRESLGHAQYTQAIGPTCRKMFGCFQ